MIHNLSYLCIFWLYAKTLIFIDHSIWLQLWQSGSWWLHTIFLWWNPRSCQNLQFWWWATFGKSRSKYLHQVSYYGKREKDYTFLINNSSPQEREGLLSNLLVNNSWGRFWAIWWKNSSSRFVLKIQKKSNLDLAYWLGSNFLGIEIKHILN